MTVVYRDVVSAAERICNTVHRTPVMTSDLLNRQAGCELFFKCENLQKTGAFKARGATNAVFSLSPDDLRFGVATHSSGNHGAALARAAALKGVPAFIVVPDNAKQVKQDAIRAYGAEVITCEPTLAAREAALAEVIANNGAKLVHPYDMNEVIAGQGTASLELVDQIRDLDVIITPVGGGGLLAGSALVAQKEGIDVFGAEPLGADDAHRSLATGTLKRSHVPDTICDGLLTTLGEKNFSIIAALVDEVLLVDDQQVCSAMRLIWTRMKLLVEPSSAITLAVVLKNPARFKGKRVGLVLTGGNVDLDNLPF